VFATEPFADGALLDLVPWCVKIYKKIVLYNLNYRYIFLSPCPPKGASRGVTEAGQGRRPLLCFAGTGSGGAG
jgi:hypothetical protein